jgi:hypothetical protein
MNEPFARQLIRLYPARWRARYGDEFCALLETYPRSLSTIVDVVAGALREHLRSAGVPDMNTRQQSLILMAYACLAAVAAGVNFYWTVDDTPLAVAMQRHAALHRSFNLVTDGAAFMVFVVIIVAVPIAAGIMRDAFRTRSWIAIGHLAIPPASAFIVIVWLLAGHLATGRQWVATPWDVTGDWPAPIGWPSLSIRWTMSLVTFALLIVGLLASARGVRQAIRQSDLARHERALFTGTSIMLALAIVAMTAGVAGWGWFAQQYAAADFHARNGGFFSSTNIASWTASCVVFLVASTLAVRGASAAFADAVPSRD